MPFAVRQSRPVRRAPTSETRCFADQSIHRRRIDRLLHLLYRTPQCAARDCSRRSARCPIDRSQANRNLEFPFQHSFSRRVVIQTESFWWSSSWVGWAVRAEPSVRLTHQKADRDGTSRAADSELIDDVRLSPFAKKSNPDEFSVPVHVPRQQRDSTRNSRVCRRWRHSD